MSTKNIVMLFGASGSGKDTIAEHLYHSKCIHYKFARPMKEFVEKCYNLPYGTLDTQEGKAQKLPNSDKTFADLLVGAYHFWQQFDDAMTARGVMKKVEHLILKTPWNSVISDCRKLCEAELLRDFCWQHPDVRLHVLRVVGRGEMKSSDLEQQDCINLLNNSCSYFTSVIYNEGSLESLMKTIDKFASEKLV